jgi:hypothetical protein
MRQHASAGSKVGALQPHMQRAVAVHVAA